MVELIPSAVRVGNGSLLIGTTATDAGTPVDKNVPVSKYRGGAFLLIVSAAATLVGDTCNVYLQHSIDGGTTFDDFVSFTQVLGNGGPKKFIASWIVQGTAPTSPLKPPADGTLAAGVQQGPVGNLWRAKWVIPSGSFTFQLLYEPLIDSR